MGGPAPQSSVRGPYRPRPPGPAPAARCRLLAPRSQPAARTAPSAQALLHVQRVYPRDTAPPAVPRAPPLPRPAPPRPRERGWNLGDGGGRQALRSPSAASRRPDAGRED